MQRTLKREADAATKCPVEVTLGGITRDTVSLVRDTKQITNDPEANQMLVGLPPRKGWEQYYQI